MTIRIFGAVLVIIGCGGFGFLLASAHRREVNTLRQFISVLDYIECELQYRMTPLPDLCRRVSDICCGSVRSVFSSLATELDNQISPDVEKCMIAALSKHKDLPKLTRGAMDHLGRSLGLFDLEGQLKGLEAVRSESRRILELYSKNQDTRIRSYQTLGLCAGAAIVILFI